MTFYSIVTIGDKLSKILKKKKVFIKARMTTTIMRILAVKMNGLKNIWQ